MPEGLRRRVEWERLLQVSGVTDTEPEPTTVLGTEHPVGVPAVDANGIAEDRAVAAAVVHRANEDAVDARHGRRGADPTCPSQVLLGVIPNASARISYDWNAASS